MNRHDSIKWLLPSLAAASAVAVMLHASDETLPPLGDAKAPQTFEELWAGYDPRREPLETEVLKEWEEDGAVLRVVRLRIGVFKGRKAMLAGIYGFPKGARRVPGLLQIHGGGQYADAKAPSTNARRGYATLSIAWAGRISAPDYTVTPDVVALFWAGKSGDPKYRPTTDWGALDAYHAPCRNPGNSFQSVAPQAWTLDDVESPRNNPWFLCTLAARRGLTFLEQQPEVDPERLGVYGHSMGGKLTVMTAATDRRVKAAAPSCGGISDRPAENALYAAAIADDVYLRRIACPIVFLSPANDFHGRINDLEKALGEIRSTTWRLTCAPHHNHQDTAPFQVAGPLWFDQHLKGAFDWPQTPQAALTLETAQGAPSFSVKPDLTRTPIGVDIFYTQQGKESGDKDDRENTIARFWHHAPARRSGDAWTAPLPLLDTRRPLWAYANVLYPLPTPVTAAGYYYGPFTADTFNVSSVLRVAAPEQMKAAGARATDKASSLIESFAGDWQKGWFTYDLTGRWPRRTHKLYDPKWKAPPVAKLALDVRCERPNKLVVGLDDAAAEVALDGGAHWQSVSLAPRAFKDAEGKALADWNGIRELRLNDCENLVARKAGRPEGQRRIGAPWQGAAPEFRNLRWLEEAGPLPARAENPGQTRPRWEPRFSWERVPRYMHVRKDTAFTPEEIRYLASFPLVTLEKFTGAREFGSTEAGTLAAARAIKAINPTTRVLYYRNVIVHYGGYAANDSLANVPDAFLVGRGGSDRLVRGRVQAYDLTSAKLRDWWIAAATRVCADPAIDGLFLDGNVKVLEPDYLVGEIGKAKKAEVLDGYATMMGETRRMLGPDKLMLANVLRARFPDSGMSRLRAFDGSYMEGVEAAVGDVAARDYLAKGIAAFQEAARQGFVIAFTAGLGEESPETEKADEGRTDEIRKAMAPDEAASRRFRFLLAIFLICAERHSYFCAHDGYDAKSSGVWMTHPPEFDRPLGAPKGPATRAGYTYTRDFAHASVRLDIESKSAEIHWR